MLDTDKKIYEQLKKFWDNRDRKVPPTNKTVADFAPPGLVESVGQVVAEYPRLAENPAGTILLEETAEAATLEETYFLASELSFAIQLATVRHSDVRDLLKPRIGTEPPEHLDNMLAMSRRIVEHAHALKERKIVLKLENRHEPAAVAAQAEKHRAAVFAIDSRSSSQTEKVARLQQQRKKGSALQKRINLLLKSLFGDDRATQLECGLTEREKKSRPKTPAKEAGATAQKVKGEKKKKDAKNATTTPPNATPPNTTPPNTTPPTATPPTAAPPTTTASLTTASITGAPPATAPTTVAPTPPGPVASGTAGGTSPVGASASAAAPSGSGNAHTSANTATATSPEGAAGTTSPTPPSGSTP